MVLDVVAATTDFASSEELIVHLLEGGLVESRILAPHDEGSERVEAQND